MQLENLKIIVTGAARGMGAWYATRLHESGASVCAGDVDEAMLSTLPEGIHRRRLDVTDDAEIAEFVRWSGEQMGGVNGLVNNAGILRDGLLAKRDGRTGKTKRLSREDWDQVLAVNLTGATMMAREVFAHLIDNETHGGVVVNISSISRYGNRGQSNYAAAKAAMAANTLTWAREMAPYGVRVGCVAPGMVTTPMTQAMNEKAREALVTRIPVGRIGIPEDIWLAVKFVLECDYFNARTIDVDGGLSM
jgi:3-oxoacyl-[acyl-carrier protein] reductase